jgi:hypothetical protein
MESAAGEAATMEATTMEAAAAVKTTASEASAVATKAAAASVTTATGERHGRRRKANRGSGQQRNHSLTPHHHSPSKLSHPAATQLTWRSLRRIAIVLVRKRAQLRARKLKSL